VTTVAVLASGGLDSCVLMCELARERAVVPLYVANGLAWESEEKAALQRFVERVGLPGLRTPVILPLPVGGLYGRHWSITGAGVPGADRPDEEVYLPARNVLLFTAAAIWCAANAVHEIAVGSLVGNPFPDASERFFADLAQLLSTALRHRIEIQAPYRLESKHALIARHPELPLELTLTCNAPHAGRHCGCCNKCYERQQAFARAGVADRTAYVASPV
jgi:7-cyano-7-deazaguanine synthase